MSRKAFVCPALGPSLRHTDIVPLLLRLLACSSPLHALQAR